MLIIVDIQHSFLPTPYKELPVSEPASLGQGLESCSSIFMDTSAPKLEASKTGERLTAVDHGIHAVLGMLLDEQWPVRA